jgi:aminoglycoside 6'-N-acetyltransferase
MPADAFPLDTPRLRLRRFAERDLAAFAVYRNDPDVARYQSWDGITESAAHEFIAEMAVIQPGLPGKWMQIAIERKDTGELIGDCAFCVKTDDSRQAEMGFTLARAHQRRGFATESVSRLLTYLFDTLDLHRVVAIADTRNAASVSLLERLGMRREGHFIQNVWFKGAWADEYLYALLRHEWPPTKAPDARGSVPEST